MLYDGSVCIANPDGTELSHFSGKPRRPCLLVYHDEQTGYVFPITTAKPKNATYRAGEGWVVTERVYAVPLAHLSSMGVVASLWDAPSFQKLVREKLAQRELDFLKPKDLTQRPFDALRGLAVPETETETAAKPLVPEPKKSDEFEKYLKFDLDRDMKRHDLKDK